MNEKFILTLLDRFSSAQIDELELNDGTTYLVLRKGLLAGTVPNAAMNAAFDSAFAAAEAEAQNAQSVQAGKSVHLGMPAHISPEPHSGAEQITSPIVAT